MAKGIHDAVELDTSLQETNPDIHSTLKHWSDAIIRGYERDLSAQRSEIMKATRNILTAMHSIGALILALPSSAVNNYIGGTLGLYGEFGGNIFKWKKSFKNALSNDDILGITAREVNTYVDRFLQMPGRYSDYEAKSLNTEISNNMLVKLTEHVKNASMKIADYATRQGVIIWAQNKANLTMQTSEANLRDYAKPVLFDMVRSQLDGLDMTNLSRDEQLHIVRNAIRASKIDAFFAVDNALLDPSKENKPYWSWMIMGNATNPVTAMVGAGLSMSYMFKQVASHNVRLVNNVLMKTLDNIKNPGMKGVDKYSGAGGFGFLLIALVMTAIDMMAGKKLGGIPKLSATVSSNPLQETKTVGLFAVKGLAPFLNLSMPEDMANDINSDFARLASGVLMGNTVDHILKEYQGKTDRPLGSMLNIFDSVKNSFDLITNLPYYVLGKDPSGAIAQTRGDYFAMKKEIAAKTESVYPWFSYQNDYLGFIKNLEQALIPTVKGSPAESAKADYTARAILSLFGLSPSYSREAYADAYGRRDTAEYDARTIQRTSKAIYPSGVTFYNTIGDRALRQLMKYGKIYPDSLL